MEEDKETITVKIFGETYPIRGDADPDYIVRVASYLDDRMKEVAENNVDKSISKIAILAALNITDELFQARSSGLSETKRIEEETKTILDWLDSRLPERCRS